MNTGIATWYADGALYSSVALRDLTYPFLIDVQPSDSIGVVKVALESAIKEHEHGARCIHYRVALVFNSRDSDACDIAAECIGQVADRLALLAGTSVEVQLGSVTTAPPGALTGSYRRVSRGRLTRSEPPMVNMPAADLERLLSHFSHFSTDEGTTRALRWLRHSYITDDIFLMFISRAFGLEALAPRVSVAEVDHELAGKVSSNADRLRRFAVDQCGVPPIAWRKVGKLRNQLFHGGLNENETAKENVAFAAGWSEYVLVMGIKQVLSASVSEAPVPERPGGTMTDILLTVEGPPEHMRLHAVKDRPVGARKVS